MTVDSAINWLVCSILFSFGAIVLAGLAITLNNIFHKYWKPVKWNIYDLNGKTIAEIPVQKEPKA
jgi:hypothetical protein